VPPPSPWALRAAAQNASCALLNVPAALALDQRSGAAQRAPGLPMDTPLLDGVCQQLVRPIPGEKPHRRPQDIDVAPPVGLDELSDIRETLTRTPDRSA